MEKAANKLYDALWRLYQRPDRPVPWANGGNLPWDDPAFSERMLREHLDQTHGAASRVDQERAAQIPWLINHLSLQPGMHLLDVTCGPGLYAVAFAQNQIQVTGIDFAPAAVNHARRLARETGVSDICQFIQHDVRTFNFPSAEFEAATVLYGQLAVMTKSEALNLIKNVYRALKPGGTLILELLNSERIDKSESSWWFTDDRGLWGDTPFLCLGERQWHDAEQISIERYHVFHLDNGKVDEVILCDQLYTVDDMKEMLQAAGFRDICHFLQWDNLPLYDAVEWVVYKGVKKS